MKTVLSPLLALALVLLAVSFTGDSLETRNKRHAWTVMQNDGQVPVAQSAQFMAQCPPCEPSLSTFSKRSIQSVDSFPNLSHYFLNEDNSDVKLVVNGTKLAAHKFVLSAKSRVFAEMFRADPTKAEFDMGLDSDDTFKVMLRYFYTEKFQMDNENDYDKAIQVFHLATNYEVEGLKAQVERALAKLIKIDNFLDILKFAEDNQMHELVKLWMTFVFSNSLQIIEEQKFVNESNGVVIKVLAALNAPASYVLNKLKTMMEEDPSLRPDDVRHVIRLERCSLDDLVTLAQMGLYDFKFLFDDMIKRYRALSSTCQRPVRRIVQPRWLPNSPVV